MVLLMLPDNHIFTFKRRVYNYLRSKGMKVVPFNRRVLQISLKRWRYIGYPSNENSCAQYAL